MGTDSWFSRERVSPCHRMAGGKSMVASLLVNRFPKDRSKDVIITKEIIQKTKNLPLSSHRVIVLASWKQIQQQDFQRQVELFPCETLQRGGDIFWCLQDSWRSLELFQRHRKYNAEEKQNFCIENGTERQEQWNQTLQGPYKVLYHYECCPIKAFSMHQRLAHLSTLVRLQHQNASLRQFSMICSCQWPGRKTSSVHSETLNSKRFCHS